MGICYSKKKSHSSEINISDTIKYQDCVQFIPPIKNGRVIKVYDGDTITIASRVPNLKNSLVYRFSVRLNGIDCPEIKSKDCEEKAIANLVKKKLSDKIFGKVVNLKNIKLEKYGRLLAEVYCGDIHINQWLLDTNCAIRYDGGTKKQICWKSYFGADINKE